MLRLTIIFIAFVALGAVVVPSASAKKRVIPDRVPAPAATAVVRSASGTVAPSRRHGPVRPQGKRKIVPGKHR